MMHGTVTGDREIVIQLPVLKTNQSHLTVSAIVNTGFNGFLTLPINVLQALEASAAGTRRAELGDGNLVEMDAYFVSVQRHAETRDVLALQAESTPLVGMSLIWGSRVSFDAREGGAVTIDTIP